MQARTVKSDELLQKRHQRACAVLVWLGQVYVLQEQNQSISLAGPEHSAGRAALQHAQLSDLLHHVLG